MRNLCLLVIVVAVLSVQAQDNSARNMCLQFTPKSEIAKCAEKVLAAKNADTLLKRFILLRIAEGKVNTILEKSTVEESGLVELDSCLTRLSRTMKVLAFTYVAEGTVPCYMVNNSLLCSMAAKTEGDNDDKFFNLLRKTWGEQGEARMSFPSWIERVTCLSGYNTAGDGEQIKLLQELAAMKRSKNAILKEEADFLINALIDDLLTDLRYKNDIVVVKEEMTSIIAAPGLADSEQKKKLKKRMAEMDPKKMSFNCGIRPCPVD